jgi:hypothetical protein
MNKTACFGTALLHSRSKPSRILSGMLWHRATPGAGSRVLRVFRCSAAAKKWACCLVRAWVTTTTNSRSWNRSLHDDGSTIFYPNSGGLDCTGVINLVAGDSVSSVYLAAYQLFAHLASTARSTFKMLVPQKGLDIHSTTIALATSADSEGPSSITSSCT